MLPRRIRQRLPRLGGPQDGFLSTAGRRLPENVGGGETRNVSSVGVEQKRRLGQVCGAVPINDEDVGAESSGLVSDLSCEGRLARSALEVASSSKAIREADHL